MRKEELRIGNLLSCGIRDIVVCTVVEIKENEITVDTTHESMPSQAWCTFGLEIEEISGIPLTERWLLEFGFDKHETKYGEHFQNEDCWIYLFPKSQKFELELNMGAERHNLYRPYDAHVHVLQNLIFALTGEELL